MNRATLSNSGVLTFLLLSVNPALSGSTHIELNGEHRFSHLNEALKDTSTEGLHKVSG